MKKAIFVTIFIAFVLVNTSYAGIERITKNSIKIEKEEVKIPEIEIKETNGYISILLENANYLHYPGKPMLPYYTKVYYFPLGTKIEVDCKPKNIEVYKIEKEIVKANPPMIKAMVKETIKADTQEIFPESWYSYNLGGGLVDGKHVTILSLHLYPVRYKQGEIEFTHGFDITIDYTLPAKPIINNDEYDLLIICPEEWKDIVDTLRQHKESHGIRTIVETVENIYAEYDGRDGAEKVKYFIKDMLEEYGIKYVLLVGGKKSYLFGNWGMDGPMKSNDALWYVPVRYVALNDNAEGGYISDLYFADIYDAYGNFSTWDTNGNGIYGEWRWGGKDILDLYPDVYVGRLACRSVAELNNVIEKIINYENSNVASQPWFRRMLLVGGDTFNDVEKICEGEVSTLYFYNNYMADKFEKVSLFVSDGTLTFGVTQPNKFAGRVAWINVIKEMSKGCGFAVLDGHGSPTAWATHFRGYASHDDPWVNGLMTYNMDLLRNRDMLPIVVIGGCHNSEFNISLFDFIKNEWTYQPTYECFSWHLVKMANKGAIATLGNTGLGYGATGGDNNKNGIPDCVEFNGGYIEDRFFNAYGIKGKDILGETWGTAIIDYINTYPPMKDLIDCKTVEEWVLLGDPSLKIGGYP